MELRSKIKEAILSMETPFCIADLLEMLPKKGIVANNNLVMQAIHMKYRRSANTTFKMTQAPSVGQSPFVRLRSVNQYSFSPCSEQNNTAIAYSKGKLSTILLASPEQELGM